MKLCVLVGLSMLVTATLAQQNDALGSLFALANGALGDGKKSSGSSGMDTLMNMASSVLGSQGGNNGQDSLMSMATDFLGGLASPSRNNGQKSSGSSAMDSLMNMATSVLGGLASQSGSNGQKSSGPFGMDSLLNMATGVLWAVTSQGENNEQKSSGSSGMDTLMNMASSVLGGSLMNMATSVLGGLTKSGGPSGTDYLQSMATGINSLVNSTGGILGKISNAAKKKEQKPYDPFGLNSARNGTGRVQGGSPYPGTNEEEEEDVLPNVSEGLNGGNTKNKPAKGLGMIYDMAMLFLGGHIASTLSIPLDSLKVKMANVRYAVKSLVPVFKSPDLIAFAKDFTNNLGCERLKPNIILKDSNKIEKCVQFMADVVNFKSCPQPEAGEEENQEEEAVDVIDDPTDNGNKAAKTWNDVPQFSSKKKCMLNLAKKFLDRVGCEKPTYRSALQKSKILCEEILVDAINNYACT
ncbi:uncharacterized protein LOC131931341 isoform X3 [Physella acuta]|uniref:uncharacterized protein LOC131931341 isoform X3 n=1 Tax=Physella acuta TaxID=109671 RepID=UPI0027DC5724|nr:uncharacterized protein LOC131931341 isoform X3 [Physella acuta]